MLLSNRSGPVTIILGGVVTTVPYRQAVGHIAAGRATWAPVVEPEAPAPKVKKPRSKPVTATVVAEEGPELVDLTPGTVVPVETSAVSAPTIGAEGEETEYLPSPPDQ